MNTDAATPLDGNAIVFCEGAFTHYLREDPRMAWSAVPRSYTG